MKASLFDYLPVVTPHLDPTLVPPAALQLIQALARHLPVACAALLECRLSPTDPVVDFHAGFTHIPPDLTDAFELNAAWQACQTFCQAWMDPASALHPAIHNLILEFDLPQPFTDPPVITALSPSPFIMFKPAPAEQLQALVEQTLTLLHSSPNPALIATINHCLHALPQGATLANIGVWLARPHQAVRLTVKAIQFEQLPTYLEQIGWNYPIQSLMAYTSRLTPFVNTLALALDLDPTLHPRIGLECFATQEFHDPDRWQRLIDHLVQTGLCSPAKGNALLTWTGFTQQSDCPDCWPANLAYGDLLMGANAVSLFWRRINHIKLVYQPGQPLSAKAYLAFGHCWMSRDSVVFAEKPQDSMFHK